MHSLNGFKGRQTWEYEEQAGDLAERAAVDKARAEFTQHRHEQRHSADLLMRYQVCTWMVMGMVARIRASVASALVGWVGFRMGFLAYLESRVWATWHSRIALDTTHILCGNITGIKKMNQEAPYGMGKVSLGW